MKTKRYKENGVKMVDITTNNCTNCPVIDQPLEDDICPSCGKKLKLTTVTIEE